MTFQIVLDASTSFSVNTRRIVGQQVARSGQVRTAEYLSSVPWVFTVTMMAYGYYPTARFFIQNIDNLDRLSTDTLRFSSSTLSWFTKYQGDLTDAQRNALTLAAVPPANSKIISVGNLPSVAVGAFIFKQGDFIQLGLYPYKVAYDVVRGSGSTVSVTLHRSVIGTVSTGTLTATASDCVWTVVAERCPTYTLNPMTNGAFIQWDGDFVFREAVGMT